MKHLRFRRRDVHLVITNSLIRPRLTPGTEDGKLLRTRRYSVAQFADALEITGEEILSVHGPFPGGDTVDVVTRKPE